MERLRVKPAMTAQSSDLTTVETLHAISLQREKRGLAPCFFRHSALDAESPENMERLRVKPAMTAQSKEHRKPTVCDYV
jgi:hypothetical protein